MIILLIPVGVTVNTLAYPQAQSTIQGKLRVGEIQITNNGWFTQHVHLPELTGCIGDQEVPLDAWIASDSGVASGAGQVSSITVAPGESGKIYLVATDATIYENMLIYERTTGFSCLDPGTPIS